MSIFLTILGETLSPFQLRLIKSGKELKIPFRPPQKIWHIEQTAFGADYVEMWVYLDFTDKYGLPQGFANEEKTKEFKYQLWTNYYAINHINVSACLSNFYLSMLQNIVVN